jgi:chemotaxis protein methyltransferase CheR
MTAGLARWQTDATADVMVMLLDSSSAIEPEREFRFRAEEFQYISSLVYERSGIVLAAHKKDMVYTRLARRLRALGLTSFEDYCHLIQSDEGTAEIGSLINAITTNLTKFFRENHHFEHLRQVALRDATDKVLHGSLRRLRIWSAGCSSGEEPYSIAITIIESIPGIAQWDARILATDLDTSMVAKAAAGVYAPAALDEVPNAIRAKYFERVRRTEGESWLVSERARRLLTFKQLNLLEPWPMRGPFDAIFCRNVMIYFDAATKVNLVGRYAELLRPKGWLYIGHSESLLEDQSLFKLRGRTIYQKVAE